MSKPQNPPMFPHIHGCNVQGISLRDWFAGMAMQGIIANGGTNYNAVGQAEDAELAYNIADAMLAEREKGDQSS